MIGGVRLPAGTKIFLNVLGIHHNPAYYPDPEVTVCFDVDCRDWRHGQESRLCKPSRACVALRFSMAA